MAAVVMMVPIEEVRMSHRYQHPDGLKKYVSMLKLGEPTDPIEVVEHDPRFGTKYIILNGNHRYKAHLLEGRSHVEIVIGAIK